MRLAAIPLLALVVMTSAAAGQNAPMRGPNGRYHVLEPGVVAPKQAPQPTPEPPPPPQPELKPYIAPPPPIEIPLPPQPDAVVTTTFGQVGGEDYGDGTWTFKAIPFASPPVGDLRWMPPEDPAHWKGVRYNPSSAPACLQVSYGWNADLAKSSSEDCLYLEVRTPDLDSHAKKAVMVFIHGGANRAGGGAGTIYSGFAGKDVVIVSLQYRLGVFGFMSHPALTRESGHDASGNYALLDLMQALYWVKTNIAQFGGDPNNVTIFGHSAGAGDVGLLMSSPLARGLFNKAISESGPPAVWLPAAHPGPERGSGCRKGFGGCVIRRRRHSQGEEGGTEGGKRDPPLVVCFVTADSRPGIVWYVCGRVTYTLPPPAPLPRTASPSARLRRGLQRRAARTGWWVAVGCADGRPWHISALEVREADRLRRVVMASLAFVRQPGRRGTPRARRPRPPRVAGAEGTKRHPHNAALRRRTSQRFRPDAKRTLIDEPTGMETGARKRHVGFPAERARCSIKHRVGGSQFRPQQHVTVRTLTGRLCRTPTTTRELKLGTSPWHAASLLHFVFDLEPYQTGLYRHRSQPCSQRRCSHSRLFSSAPTARPQPRPLVMASCLASLPTPPQKQHS